VITFFFLKVISINETYQTRYMLLIKEMGVSRDRKYLLCSTSSTEVVKDKKVAKDKSTNDHFFFP